MDVFEGFPRVDLAHLPTPLERADRLGAALGLAPGRLAVKRDDATGLAAGGNKVRKLEYLCAEAQANGADWLVTAGGPQSNHARATAAAARRLGMGVTLLLDGSQVESYSGNLVLDSLLGAQIVWVTESLWGGDIEQAIRDHADKLSAEGHHAYPVTVGGSVPLGALGYVRASQEIRAQVPDVSAVFVATGSCGTHAGLVAGFGDHAMVRGVRVGERENLEDRVATLARETALLAGMPQPAGVPQIDHDHLGDGYGAHTDACVESMALAARTEGLILDPVYTGKAMAGLVAAARAGTLPETGTVVYLHTGGMPGLLSDNHGDWAARATAALEVS